ncbi:MAG: HD domain-containing protein [Chloroflexi bacterium]|nr:HD domain-containing protein [Chloroflexota bacterium]
MRAAAAVSPPLSAGAAALFLRLAALLPAESDPWVVGGFLRDALLGRESRDLDLVVRGDAISVARQLADALGGAFVPLDEPHRIARVILGQGEDGWRVDLSALRGDLVEDLGHRDFTINAMAVPLGSLQESDWRASLIDPLGGVQDLQRRLVRAVGPAVFREDGVRLLRAVRLASSLGFEIEPATRALMRRDAVVLEGVAGERVRDEFLLVLSHTNALGFLLLMDDLGLLSRVLPDLESGRGVTQPKEHAWDVFTHGLQAVGAVEGLLERRWEPSWALDDVPWNEERRHFFQQVASDGHTRATLLKLAGLLHDVGKPATRSVEPSGRIRFRGHHTLGASLARDALQRLRLSGRGVQMVEAMVRHHLRPGQLSPDGQLPTPRAVYRYFRDVGDVAVDTVYLNLADYLAARGPLLERQEWAAYAGKVRAVLEMGLVQKEPQRAHRLLTGDDLMAALRLPPGPLIGQVLEVLREAQAAGEVTTQGEALALARKLLASQAGRGRHA